MKYFCKLTKSPKMNKSAYNSVINLGTPGIFILNVPVDFLSKTLGSG